MSFINSHEYCMMGYMQDSKKYFQNKRITLMGLGLLGRGVGDARYLAKCSAGLVVTDLKSRSELQSSLKELRDFPDIQFHLGGHRLEDFQNRDLIIKAAGIPLGSPFIAEAKKNNVPVRMSTDLFVELSGVTTIGITGTRGKSTITYLVTHILKTAGKKVLMGGNICGMSTLEEIGEVTPETIAVLELDSWQLQGFGEVHLSPHIAIFSTFMPDHMNYYHSDLESYFKDKANIFLNQSPADHVVVGGQVAPFLKQFNYSSKIKSKVSIIGLKDFPKNWQLQILGEHNQSNAALAIEALRIFGLDEKDIQKGVETFNGVEGRLQLVRELQGIKIYNDTCSTTPESTKVALEALDPDKKRNILLIAGGADKGLDMRGVQKSIAEHCKKVYFLSGTGTKRVWGGEKSYDSLEGAFNTAISDAVLGDIVILSPAFASFGMFKNEYDRGDQFNLVVSKLS